MNHYNPNKAVSCSSTGIRVYYTDTLKSHSIIYDEQSILKDVQFTTDKRTYQKIVTTPSELTQKMLYTQVMYGLKSYSEQELKKMPYVQKMKIKEVYDQAQFKLNLWKQELVHEKIGSFLTTLFHRSTFAKSMAVYPRSINPWDRSSVTFNELGIRKERIIEKLIDLKILPQNFYELSM